jgi:peptide/nickel transport system permease protein
MFRYLLLRLCYSILVLWGVATVVFLLFNVLLQYRARPITVPRSNQSSVETRKAQYSDISLWTRYGLYLNDLSPIGVTSTRKTAEAPQVLHIIRLEGNIYLSLKALYLGHSNDNKRSVSVMLGRALPATIVLALTSLLIAIVVGIALGILSALKKGTVWDTSALAASVAGMSMPSFVVALIIAYAAGLFDRPHLAMPMLILPAVALGIRPMAIIMQQTRNALLDVLNQHYIRTAYAKGLSKARVIFVHALPNILISVVAAIPACLAEVLAGSFFVEYIFARKGIGSITVAALDKSDLPLVTGAVLLTALIFVIARLLTDVLQAVLDRRASLR